MSTATSLTNGTSPNWAESVARDLVKLTRAVSATEIIPGSEPADSHDVLGEILGELRRLRIVVEMQGEHQVQLVRLIAAGVDITLSGDDFALALDLSRRELDRMVSAGEAPKPCFKQGRSSRWRSSVVRDHINTLAEKARCRR
jgi:predicted DNA-binding transcriptional regulator AlpA